MSDQVADYLLYPANRKLAEHLRAGGTVKGLRETRLKTEWRPHAAVCLTAWLKTGDLDPLARLIREAPFVIAHPVVFWQIVHLRRLSRRWDRGDLAGDIERGASVSPVEEESAPPAGTRRAARDALERLVSSWVHGVLPGWNLEPPRPRKRRGRPTAVDPEEELDVLTSSCEELLARLKETRATHPLVFIRRHEETRDAYAERLARDIIPAVHAPNPYAAYERQTEPLPADTAGQIAKDAVGGGGFSSRRLVYALLGYYTGRTREQVRGIIERAAKTTPTWSRPKGGSCPR